MFLITEIKAWNFISPLLYLRCLCPPIGTNGFGKHDYCGICDGPTDKSSRLAANDETSVLDFSPETSIRRGSQAVVPSLGCGGL